METKSTTDPKTDSMASDIKSETGTTTEPNTGVCAMCHHEHKADGTCDCGCKK